MYRTRPINIPINGNRFQNNLTPEQQKIIADYNNLQDQLMENEEEASNQEQASKYINQFKFIADAMYEHPLVQQFLSRKNRGIGLNDVLPYIAPAVIDNLMSKKDFDPSNAATISVGIANQILAHLKLEQE